MASSACPHARGGEPQAWLAALICAAPVPTHVGVNPLTTIKNGIVNACPHARGGEPLSYGESGMTAEPVPTHVGVNPADR